MTSTNHSTIAGDLGKALFGLLSAHDLEKGVNGLLEAAAVDGWNDMLAVPLLEGDQGGLEEALDACEVWGRVGAPLQFTINVGYLGPLVALLPESGLQILLGDALADGRRIAVDTTLLSAWIGTAGTTASSGGDTRATTSLTAGDPELILHRGIDSHGSFVALADAHATGVAVTDQPTIVAGVSMGSIQVNDLPSMARDQVEGPVAGALAAAAGIWAMSQNATTIGLCSEVVDRSARYSAERIQFDQPIRNFQAVSHLLADMEIATQTGRCLARQAIHGWRDGDPQGLAAARLYLAERASAVCESAIQVHGGAGFTWEFGLHRFYRAALLDLMVLAGRDELRDFLEVSILEAGRGS